VRTTDHEARSVVTFEDSTTAEVSAAIARLVTTRDTEEVERLADQLADQAKNDLWSGDTRVELVNALVRCLTADSIREDADAEDAVCSALEQIGVMTRLDNLVFVFRPDSELGANDLITVRRYRGWLPSKYAVPTSAR
jgi:hypothetical protein